MSPVAKAPVKPKVSKPGRALARPGDPLIGPDGSKIEAIGGAVSKLHKQKDQVTINPETYRPTKRRTLKEVPGEVHMVNAVAVVFMYTLLGVGDREIADALKTTVDDIERLRQHSAYSECFQIIHGEFINANSDLLTSRIAAFSQDALTTVGHLAGNAKKEETRLNASKDILDRAGVRPKDQDQRVSMTQNHLRIIIVDGEKPTNVQVTLEGEE